MGARRERVGNLDSRRVFGGGLLAIALGGAALRLVYVLVLARHVPDIGDALVFHTFLLHCSQPNRSGATRWTLQARYFDFLNRTAVRHDWVGGMNEGVDFRRYHPELVAGPADG